MKFLSRLAFLRSFFVRCAVVAGAGALGLGGTGCTTAGRSPLIETASLPRPVRVACVGDSITFGYLLPDRDRESYPARLTQLLGTGWEVGNFGRSGATMLRQGHRPYRDQPECTAALAFRPHVVFLQLGTNDTKRETWAATGDKLVTDTVALIREFQAIDSHPQVIVCLPIPIFRDRGKPWDSDRLLRDTITPRLREAARQAGVPTLDLYVVFADQSASLPDGVHPDARGADLMARTIYTAITGQPAKDKP